MAAESGQDASVFSVIEGGAPRSGSKLTVHGPSTLVKVVCVTLGNWRAISDVALRNTTNTVPHGSRCSGTVVRPSAIVYEACSVFPVSARQSSGDLPVTR